MIRRPPRSTLDRSSAASDVYKRQIYVCLLAPIIILALDFINNIEWFAKKIPMNPDLVLKLTNLSNSIFNGYKIGIEILIINGMLTMLGLFLISKSENLQKNK